MGKLKIVVDTNIIVNAIRRGTKMSSKSKKLLLDIFLGKYEVYLSSSIMEEYSRVLYTYKRINADPLLRRIWFKWISKYGRFIEPNPSDQEHVKMHDEDDRIFFDVAKCVNAKLVTRNFKDYPVHELITLIDELYP